MFIEHLVAAFFGLGLHFSLKWMEARNASTSPPGFFGYIKSVPAQTTVSLFGTAGSFWVCHLLDWLNPGMAFACGYVGNSIAENLGNRFSALK